MGDWASVEDDKKYADAGRNYLNESEEEIEGADGMGEFDSLIHDYVVDEYESNGRSVSRTSRELGVHRSLVYRHLRKIK